MGLLDKVSYWSNRLTASLQAANKARRSYPQGSPERENANKERDRAAIKLVGYSHELVNRAKESAEYGLELVEKNVELEKRVKELQGAKKVSE